MYVHIIIRHMYTPGQGRTHITASAPHTLHLSPPSHPLNLSPSHPLTLSPSHLLILPGWKPFHPPTLLLPLLLLVPLLHLPLLSFPASPLAISPPSLDAAAAPPTPTPAPAPAPAPSPPPPPAPAHAPPTESVKGIILGSMRCLTVPVKHIILSSMIHVEPVFTGQNLPGAQTTPAPSLKREARIR